MHLEGSCCCKAVAFTVDSPHPYPFMHCYCSICRKTAGAGGFAINISGDYRTLEVEGESNLGVYRAMVRAKDTGDLQESQAARHFCKSCASALWVWDPRWPELVHPYASAIDTPLPTPPERHHIFLDSKPGWVSVPASDTDRHHDGYPNIGSLADWHEQHGLVR